MPHGTVRTEAGQRRIRAFLAGHVAFDTTDPLLVWERPYYPTYYVPRSDVEADLEPTGQTTEVTDLGEAELFDVVLPDVQARDAARVQVHDPNLKDYVRFEWGAFDSWFEEDEQVFTHARDPYTRIDILPSSRHVVVELGGVRIAESRRPHVLFETGLKPRYYLPQSDVRMDLLEPSDTRSHCPYKGEARYFSILSGQDRLSDAVWSYRTPLAESTRIAGLVSFWPERSKRLEVYVDGVRLGR
jgi:uncharacterized protein (DUF427 family)